MNQKTGKTFIENMMEFMPEKRLFNGEFWECI